MASMTEWLQRCSAARAAGQAIPDAALFRRMIAHDEWHCAAADVYCSAALVPTGAAAVEPMNGLQLASSSTPAMRLHFDSASPPLVLTAEEVQHFRSFLPVTVVEALLQRFHAGADLQVEQPFERLREFDGFLSVCADEGEQPGGGAPLRMALVPDEGGRKLAAAFTAVDALQLFVASKERGGHSMVSARLSGRELFEAVAANAALDGLVINPAGPGQPLALTREAASAILAG